MLQGIFDMKSDLTIRELEIELSKLQTIVSEYNSSRFADHRLSYLQDHKRQLVNLKIEISSLLEHLIRGLE